MSVPRRAIVIGLATGFVTVVCAVLLLAAALVPAPAFVLPLVIAVGLGCPMAATFEFARVVSAVREPAAALRRELDRLPETPHPMGY